MTPEEFEEAKLRQQMLNSDGINRLRALLEENSNDNLISIMSLITLASQSGDVNTANVMVGEILGYLHFVRGVDAEGNKLPDLAGGLNEPIE